MPERKGMEIVLVRHGETEWSRAGRHTGVTDVPLTERGREQARLLGRALADRRFERVLTSPLQRAAQTCRIAGLSDVAEVEDDLREWDYGSYEGRTTKEIREEVPGWTIWTHGAPGGESAAAVGRRCDRILQQLGHIDGDVALFAHGHLLRALASRWCGLEATQGRLLALDTSTLSAIGFERETRVIKLWNEASHLRVEAR